MIQDALIPFIRQVKDAGYAVKLDTNGTSADKLEILLQENLVDYVSLDIKNVPEKYALTSGLKSDSEYRDTILECIKLLRKYKVDHEFRTTVVQEFHTVEDIIEIAKFIGESGRYVLQQFHAGDNVIQPDLHAYTMKEMEQMKEAVASIVKEVVIR